MNVTNQQPRRAAEEAGSRPAHVVVLGLMGSGKTVAGDALAAHLGRASFDNDRMLVDATGLTGREVREQLGTAKLHELEARHFLDAIATTEPSVISAAASVVENERCLEVLGGPAALPIWLRASAETLAARFDNEDHRPIFSDDPLGFFRTQIAERTPLFSAVSLAIVDVDGRSLQDVVDDVLVAADELLATRRAAT
jgi:shikimate kinase